MTAANMVAEALAFASADNRERMNEGDFDAVYMAALAHLAERCEKTTDALVLARVETAKATGRTERALVAGEALLVQLTEAKERAARAEAALDAAEREASLRLDRINTLRLCVPRDILDIDDQQATERTRKYGPMAVTVDKPGGFAFVGHTGDTYAEGRAVRETTSALNPGSRVRLWRLVCVEDWYRLPGEEANK